MCSVSSGASGAISITSGFRRLARTDPIRKVLCKYEQRFSLLLSSSLSPERIDESVLRESPLVHEHTGSGGVGHTSCDTGALIVVVCRGTDCRRPPNLCGTGATLHKAKRLQVCGRRNSGLAEPSPQIVPGLRVVVGHLKRHYLSIPECARDHHEIFQTMGNPLSRRLNG